LEHRATIGTSGRQVVARLERWQLAADRAGLVPLSRLGTADEIAKAVVFLISADASYVTGTELFVDSGFA
jgi:NAD(P)-dependent dehydrogenase (short-subunit alcohol dehydrogenase family)